MALLLTQRILALLSHIQYIIKLALQPRKKIMIRCCYVTVEGSMAASQYGIENNPEHLGKCVRMNVCVTVVRQVNKKLIRVACCY